jgi:hypothetical protein
MAPLRIPWPRLAGALLALGTLSCGHGMEARPPVEELLLERQRVGLEALITAAKNGRLIPFDQVLVVVPQKLVQELIEATLPYEQVLENRYRVRVESARVTFDDGFGLVQLRGRASLADDPSTAAQIDVYGALDVVDLDPASGILRGRVKVIAIETRRVDVVGFPAPVRRFVDELSRQQLSAFEPLLSSIEIPVKIARQIQVPEVNESGVHIAQAVLPVEAGVVDVKAFHGKLWVCAAARAEIQAEKP